MLRLRVSTLIPDKEAAVSGVARLGLPLLPVLRHAAKGATHIRRLHELTRYRESQHLQVPDPSASNKARETKGAQFSWKLPLLRVVRQHSLSTLNTLAEAVLKHVVALAFLDVPGNRQANHLRNRLTVNGCDRVQFLRLFGRQANCHRF